MAILPILLSNQIFMQFPERIDHFLQQNVCTFAVFFKFKGVISKFKNIIIFYKSILTATTLSIFSYEIKLKHSDKIILVFEFYIIFIAKN